MIARVMLPRVHGYATARDCAFMTGVQELANGTLDRFLGGSPLSVAVRLALLCVLVGFILTVFGFDPWNIWRSLQDLVQAIWNLGFDAIWSLWRYFLLGAVIVIPIWLIARLAKGARS
jgi:hypothetical protein